MKRMSELCPGERGVVVFIDSQTSMRRRFFDLGLVLGTVVECVGKSPCGDPSAYLIRGAVIAIRECDSSKIFVR